MHAIYFYEAALNNEKDSMKYLDKAINIDPCYEEALIYNAECLNRANKWLDALNCLDQILKMETAI